VRKIQILLPLIGLVALLTPARAGSLALDLTGTGSFGASPTGYNDLGWQFQVNIAILVDGLAFWDHTMNAPHDVGIYSDATQLLLVSATVLPSDPQMGTGPWRVHSITPFLLTPGVYDIAAETGSDNYTFNPTSMFTMPEITFLQNAYLFGNTVLAFPSQTSPSVAQGYFGPSFTATDAPVPEPATWGLLGAGLLGIAVLVRRREQAA
jgi:hypothetical protein